MVTGLDKNQIEDLLHNVVYSSEVLSWKGNKIQFCCTVHGESHPSCGINLDFSPMDSPNKHYQCFNCLACGAHGTIPWFLFKSLPDKFKNLKQAEKFIFERYGVSYEYTYDSKTDSIKHYEDFYENDGDKRFILPRSKMAPFKSGKETYQYFFNRGFDNDDVKKFMIGRDTDSKTVTIPLFWDNGELAGIIGRYISSSRPSNSRYKIYDFPRSGLIYPLDKVQTIDDTLILVEGQFDCIMLHKWGYTNAVCTCTNSMSLAQSQQIISRCKRLICIYDNDGMGKDGLFRIKNLLKDKVMVLIPTYYPEYGKDPCEWGKEETIKVIKSAAYRKLCPKI